VPLWLNKRKNCTKNSSCYS